MSIQEATEIHDAEHDRALRLLVQNAVLRIALRHHNLLQRKVFDEIAGVVGRYTTMAAMGLIVRNGPAHVRIYAVSKDGPDFAPMGARIPATPHLVQGVHAEGRTIYCDDTRDGTGQERLLAQSGFLSYVDLPVRPAPGEPPLAGLMIAFREVGEARSAPLAILEDVAEIIGAQMQRAIDAARDRRLAMILETSGDAMISWDGEDRVTDVNAAAVALTGASREELLGTSILALLTPMDPAPRPAGGSEPPAPAASKDPSPPRKAGGSEPPASEEAPSGLRSRADSGLASARRPPAPPHGERMLLRGRDGPRAVAATITSVDDDPIVAAHALLRDISSLVRTEDAAAQRLARIGRLEAQHRAVLDNVPLILFRLDPVTLELRFLNGHAERLLGVPRDQAMSTPGFLRAAHADAESAAELDRAIEVARAGRGATPYEARLRRRGGDEVTVQGTVYPDLDLSGEVVAIEGVLADVSSEHAARSRLVQNDRLSTLGTLAAGVAHEINNPAAFVLLGIDMLDRLLTTAARDMPEGPRSQAGALIRELRDSVRRIVDIARDLRLFASAPAAGRRTFVDVNRAVEGAITLTRGHIIERAQIHRELDDVPPVLMEDNRLGQVLVNLLVNAAQAIPKPGAAPPGEAPFKHTISVVTRVDDESVFIEVSDTGVGIPPENRARIFQPFFSTKGPELGTGLGLSISKDIVERAGGALTVESPVPGTDRGTRFTVRLPIAQETASPFARPSPPPSSRRVLPARARVLLVEDEPALARALAEGIGRAHDVELVPNGQRALEVLFPAASGDLAPNTLVSGRLPGEDSADYAERTAGGEGSAEEGPRFDVVLCDLRMPGMSGEALYTEVKSRDEDQARAFIFMTGVGFGAEVERFLRESGRYVLEKPFGTDAVLELIGKQLAKRARASA